MTFLILFVTLMLGVLIFELAVAVSN